VNDTDAVPGDLKARLANVRVLFCDVDGTLTYCSVTFDSAGVETRSFHIHDGLGIVAASLVGLRCVWITGRDTPVVRRRAEELSIAGLLQGVKDKGAAVRGFVSSSGLSTAETAFIGDDLNDLPGMRACGVSLAPSDAVPDVQSTVDWVLTRPGGRGAVREAIELILRSRGEWEIARSLYERGITAPESAQALRPPVQ